MMNTSQIERRKKVVGKMGWVNLKNDKSKLILLVGVFAWLGWYIHFSILAPCSADNRVINCTLDMLVFRPLVMAIFILGPAVLLYWVVKGTNRSRRIMIASFILALAAGLFMALDYIPIENSEIPRANTPTVLLAKVNFNEEQAVQKVRELPQVKEAEETYYKKYGDSLYIEIDREEDNAWKIHIFDIINDGIDDIADGKWQPMSHTNTYFWLSVDKTTGEVYDDMTFKKLSD